MAEELRVRIDWNNDGGFDHAESDVGARLIRASWHLGRSSITRSFEGGSGQFVMWNHDNALTPYNNSGALFGLIEPFREVWIQLIDEDGAAHDRFRGYISKIVVRPGPEDRTATVYFVDALRLMELIQFSLALQEDQIVSDLMTSVLEKVRTIKVPPETYFTWDIQGAWNGFDIAPLYASHDQFIKNSIDDITDVIPFAGWDQATARQALEELVEVSGASMWVDSTGRIVIHSRYWDLDIEQKTSLATIGAEVESTEFEFDEKQIVNHVRATVQGYTRDTKTTRVLWEEENTPIVLDAGERRVFEVDYLQAAADVFDPVVDVDYIANDQANGLGVNVSANQSVEFESFFRSADLVVTNTLARPAFLTRLQVRGTQLNADNALIEESLDGISAGKYFTRTRNIQNPWIQNRKRARALAFQIQIKSSSPVATPRIPMASGPERWERGIGDRITLGLEKDMESKDYVIQAIDEVARPKIPEGIALETTWMIEEAPTQPGDQDYFRWDVGAGFDIGLVAF